LKQDDKMKLDEKIKIDTPGIPIPPFGGGGGGSGLGMGGGEGGTGGGRGGSGIRSVYASLDNVMKSVIRYGSATQGSTAQYAPYIGREEAGIKTLEQLRDTSGEGANAVLARFMSTRAPQSMSMAAMSPKPNFPQPNVKYPLPGKNNVFKKLGFKRR
jgi:hypothetical protein